jgi:nucleotide-binding universal stress UspA family protein
VVSDDPARIVVGIDGSESSARALDWAVTEATYRRAPLHLVTAWMFPMAEGYAFTATVPQVHEAAGEVCERAADEVRRRAPQLHVSTQTVQQTPGAALVAASDGADLLVVGSRGLGGFEGLVMGSVSQYCARHASCSVVVVR